ncbi:restriction endonuclease [Emticicia fontis]
MKWQEYQEAVAVLYEQMAEFGVVYKNLTIPDKVTGQARQIDVWWEMQLENHTFKILIDAKKRSAKVDVKDVEEIMMLANAVNADKAIIVTNNDWTKPAELSAKFNRLDLKILTFDEATDLIVEDKWLMCQVCKEDCVLLDDDGFFEFNGLINWWLGGKCRSCQSIYIHCQGCGDRGIINTKAEEWQCSCPYVWKSENGLILVYYYNED